MMRYSQFPIPKRFSEPHLAHLPIQYYVNTLTIESAKKPTVFICHNRLCVGGIERIFLNMCKHFSQGEFRVIAVTDQSHLPESDPTVALECAQTPDLAIINVEAIDKPTTRAVLRKLVEHFTPACIWQLGQWGAMAGIVSEMSVPYVLKFAGWNGMDQQVDIHQAAALVFEYQEFHNEFSRKYPQFDCKKLNMIFNGVEMPDRLLDPLERQMRRSAFHLPADDCVIVIPARFTEVKNHLFLVAIMERLLARGISNVTFWLLGRDQGTQKRLELAIENHSLTRNFVIRTDVSADIHRFLSVADICCLCSTREGAPMAISEAMACGVATCGSTVGAIPELVGDSQLVFSPVDLEGATDVLLRLISQPQERQQVANRQVALARERFSMERCMRSYRELTRRVMSPRSALRPRSRSDIHLAVGYSNMVDPVPQNMVVILWNQVAAALANTGYSVTLLRNLNKLEHSQPSIAIQPADSSLVNYDGIFTVYHQGAEFVRSRLLDKQFFCAVLGSVVAATDTSGVYFFGPHRDALFAQQRTIASRADAVGFVSKPNQKLFHNIHGSPGGSLFSPGGVDSEIPRPRESPYGDNVKRTALYLGNIYHGQQKELNQLWQERLNQIGRGLKAYQIDLHFVGTGDTSQLNPEWVRVRNAVPYNESWDYQYFANVGLALADGEITDNESTKLYNYLRVGLPTVTEASLPNASIVQSLAAGVVVPFSENTDALVQAITRVCNDKWDRERIQRAAADRFNWKWRIRPYDHYLRKVFGLLPELNVSDERLVQAAIDAMLIVSGPWMTTAEKRGVEALIHWLDSLGIPTDVLWLGGEYSWLQATLLEYSQANLFTLPDIQTEDQEGVSVALNQFLTDRHYDAAFLFPVPGIILPIRRSGVRWIYTLESSRTLPLAGICRHLADVIVSIDQGISNEIRAHLGFLGLDSKKPIMRWSGAGPLVSKVQGPRPGLLAQCVNKWKRNADEFFLVACASKGAKDEVQLLKDALAGIGAWPHSKTMTMILILENGGIQRFASRTSASPERLLDPGNDEGIRSHILPSLIAEADAVAILKQSDIAHEAISLAENRDTRLLYVGESGGPRSATRNRYYLDSSAGVDQAIHLLHYLCLTGADKYADSALVDHNQFPESHAMAKLIARPFSGRVEEFPLPIHLVCVGVSPFNSNGGGAGIQRIAETVASRNARNRVVYVHNVKQSKTLDNFTVFSSNEPNLLEKTLNALGPVSAIQVCILCCPDTKANRMFSELRIRGFRAVYRAADDWSGYFHTSTEWDIKLETATVQISDVRFAVSKHLAELLEHRHGVPFKVLRNAVSREHIGVRERICPPEMPTQFTVSCAAWLGNPEFDWETIEELLTLAESQAPELSFVFIGQMGDHAKLIRSAISGHRNVTILPSVSYREIARFLAHSNVGLVAIRDGRFGRSMDSLKVYEYLAAGLPVLIPNVSTFELPVAQAFIHRYLDAEDCLRQILHLKETAPDWRKISDLMHGETWDHRWSQIISEVL